MMGIKQTYECGYKLFGLVRLHPKWRADVPVMDEENWEEIWKYLFLQLVAVRVQLIQLKLLHRFYLTPQWFNRIYSGGLTSLIYSGIYNM